MAWRFLERGISMPPSLAGWDLVSSFPSTRRIYILNKLKLKIESNYSLIKEDCWIVIMGECSCSTCGASSTHSCESCSCCTVCSSFIPPPHSPPPPLRLFPLFVSTLSLSLSHPRLSHFKASPKFHSTKSPLTTNLLETSQNHSTNRWPPWYRYSLGARMRGGWIDKDISAGNELEIYESVIWPWDKGVCSDILILGKDGEMNLVDNVGMKYTKLQEMAYKSKNNCSLRISCSPLHR